MRKKNRNIAIFLIILALAVVGFLVSKNQPLAISDLDSSLGQCSGGFTTLSVSDVNIDPIGDRIRIFGVAKGSECLKISLRASDLNNKLDDEGLKATRDVTGEVRLLEYTKTFPVDKTGQTFPSIENSNQGFRFPLACTLNYCKSKFATSFGTFRSGTLKTDCNCVYTGANGIEGGFDNSRSYGNFKIKFTIDGQSVILSREQRSGTISSGSANVGVHRIEWVGNLQNLDKISVPGYDARLISSKWDLVRDGARGDIINSGQNFVSCTGGSSGGLFGTFQELLLSSSKYATCKTTFDASSSTILSSKLEAYKQANSPLIYDADTDSNALYVSMKATPYPAFILDLDAESVGIIALEGKPKITQCIQTQNDLRSGQNKIVSFSVRNDAPVDNVEFFASISCNQAVTSFIPSFNIGANQEKTIITELIPVNPQQSDLSFSCGLKVNDLKGENSDSCGFTGKVAYESGIICEPNSLSCDTEFKNILRCSADGKNKVVYQECTLGCELTSSGAKCRESPEPPNISNKCSSCDAYAKSRLIGWMLPSQQCERQLIALPPQTTLTCAFSFLKLFLVPIVFIFGLLFGKDFFSNFKAIKKLKNRESLSWFLALLISILLAYLVYTLFIVGLIFFGVFIVLRILIKLFLP